MFVNRYGAGPENYFALHGWGADHTAFAPLAAHLPAGATLHAADLPGCGRSPAPREWGVEEIVEEIVDSIRATGVDGVTLVGNCGGAIFALLAAQRLKPAFVKRMVMVDAFAYLPRYLKVFASGGFGRRAYHATFANPVGRWLTNQTLRARRDAEVDLTASFAAVDHEAARQYIVLFDEIGGVGRFRDVRAPVEIIYGENSFGAIKRSIEMWRGVFPAARAWRLKGAGHMTIQEAASRVGEITFRGDAGDAHGGAGATRAELTAGVVETCEVGI